MANEITKKISEHVKCICETTLGHENTNLLYISIFMPENDMPINLLMTHTYTILIDFSKIPKIIDEAQIKISSFIGKKICTYKDNIHTCIYWGEGEPLNLSKTQHQCKNSKIREDIKTNEIDWLKTDTTLPKWLDNLLFDTLNARYSPNWQRFDQNLDLNDDEIKIYLGTYFPRSYGESFCIANSLLNNITYRKILNSKEEINILDIGTGTGGNLVGFLCALAKHCKNNMCIYIHAIDGNSAALNTAKIIFENLDSRLSSKLVFSYDIKIIKQYDLPKPTRNLYDFILTSKIGSEIIYTGKGKSDNYYYEFLSYYAKYLSEYGTLILLDVTTKPNHTNFYPTLLNEQSSRFIQNNIEFQTIVPIPCYLYENNCFNSCFTQKKFTVSHRSASNDRSLITYRAIVRKSLTSLFHSSTPSNAEYVICVKASLEKYKKCPLSIKGNVLLDAFKI